MTTPDLHDRIKKFLNSALRKISAKDYDSAIEKLMAAEVLDKDNPEILYNLGVCYCKKELFNSASAYFKRVINLPLTFVDILTVNKMLCYSLIMANDMDQARKYINDGLNNSQNDTTLLSMKGYILEKEKQYDRALNIYRTIIEIDRSNSNAYNSAAYIISVTDGDLNEALTFARNALKHNSENPAYLDTMGLIQIKKGQFDIAKRYLKKALEKQPESKEIRDHVNQLLKITPDHK